MATKEELFKEGAKLKNEKKYDEAIVKLQESAAMDEKFTLPLHALVQCFTETNRHEESVNAAKKIVEIEPDDFMAYIALSRAYQRAGLIPEAEYAMMQGQQAQMRAQSRQA
ncbi:MAG: hypothetical protein U1D30_06135 [Planctomycetota bacterium]